MPLLGCLISQKLLTANLPLLGLVGGHFVKDIASPQLLSRDIGTPTLLPDPEAPDRAQACAPQPSAAKAHLQQCNIQFSAPVTFCRNQCVRDSVPFVSGAPTIKTLALIMITRRGVRLAAPVDPPVSAGLAGRPPAESRVDELTAVSAVKS